ncbi:hypothetical protein OSTOST_09469, partial [Ostertagia ostertagi]
MFDFLPTTAVEPTVRRRRQVIPTENEVRNRCPLKIVADYKFFSIVGKNNTALTTRYIVNMVARVNEIYTVVNWDEGQEETELERGRFVNMGFSIKELKILDKPSNQPGHYNSRDLINNGVWNSNRLLEAFTREEGSPSFCLVHLLTAQSFADSAHIGLAYVADTRGGPGGICSDSTFVGFILSNFIGDIRENVQVLQLFQMVRPALKKENVTMEFVFHIVSVRTSPRRAVYAKK